MIETKRTLLIFPDIDNTELILNYYLKNKKHLSMWEPERSDYFYTIEKWKELISENNSIFQECSAIRFLALNKDKSEVIGVCSFTNIIRGIFQACNMATQFRRNMREKAT